MKETSPAVRYRIDGTTLSMGTGATARSFTRVASLKLTDASLARFAGTYENGFAVKLQDGGLMLSGGGAPETAMTPISPSRFLVGLFGTTFVVVFATRDGKVVSFSVVGVGFTAARLP